MNSVPPSASEVLAAARFGTRLRARLGLAMVAVPLLSIVHIVRLSRNSMSTNEARRFSGLDVPWLSLAERKFRFDATGPGADVLLRIWMSVSTNQVWLRLLATLAWILSSVLVYRLVTGAVSPSHAAFGTPVAVLIFLFDGGLLRAAETFHPATLNTLVVLFVVGQMVRYRREPTATRLMLCALSCMIAVGVHAPFVVLAPGFLVAALLHRRWATTTARNDGVIGALFICLASGLVFLGELLLVRRQLGAITVTRVGRSVASLHEIINGMLGGGGSLSAVYLLIACALMFGGLLVGQRRTETSSPVPTFSSASGFCSVFCASSVVCWFVALVFARALPSAVSVVLRTDEWAGVSFGALVAVACGCAVNVFALRYIKHVRDGEHEPLGLNRRVVVVAGGFAFVLGAAIGVNSWIANAHHEPWRPLVRSVFTQSQPGDTILFANDGSRHTFEYYRSTDWARNGASDQTSGGPSFSRSLPVPLFPVDPWGGFTVDRERRIPFPSAATESALDTSKRVWVVIGNDVDLAGPGFGPLAASVPIAEFATSVGMVRLYNGRNGR